MTKRMMESYKYNKRENRIFRNKINQLYWLVAEEHVWTHASTTEYEYALECVIETLKRHQRFTAYAEKIAEKLDERAFRVVCPKS